MFLTSCHDTVSHVNKRLSIRCSSVPPCDSCKELKVGQSPLNLQPIRLDGDGVLSSRGVQRYSSKPKCHGVPVS